MIRARLGTSAIEILVSSAIVAAAFLPIYTLVQSNQKVAYLSEYHVLARRQANRALAYLTTYKYGAIVKASQGGGPPPSDVANFPSEGAKIEIKLPEAAEERDLFETPGKILDSYEARRKSMAVEVYFHELEPGFGRLVALTRWRDPVSRSEKTFFAVRFVQAPFHFVGAQ